MIVNPHESLPLFLIIDDDPGSIRLVSETLKKEGRIIFATNGQDGLSQARDRRPDLILLDAQMPEMNGFEVCAALLADPNTADIPIIFITARNDVEHEVSALSAGASDFIAKPFNPLIITHRVRTRLTLKRQADELRKLSRVDGLTGVANRRWFDEMLEIEWVKALRMKTPIGILMIDIDHFKLYNDNYGHLAGDQCLTSIAKIMAATVRHPPDILARYGGEEFVCLLPCADTSSLVSAGERVLEVVRVCRLPHAFSSVADHVTVSIGGASLTPEPSLISGVLLEAADRRLYQAKSEGRNRLAI
ncbi:two-component system, chemotaxis family, response regulator WspR [Azospirillaceae bacterium]